MGIRADLLKFYFEVEAHYYKFCDWLEKQNVPVYEYFVTPLEKVGYPSFPVAIGILVILLAAVLFTFTASTTPTFKSVHISVLGNNSQPVEGALVELLTSQSVVVANGSTNASGEVFFGDKFNAVQIRVTHSDYDVSLAPIRENVNVKLRFKTAAGSVASSRGQVQGAGNGSSRFVGDVSQFIEVDQFGSFEVTLRDKITGLPVNGGVRVFDAVTDTLIEEVQSVGGATVFENLPLNQHVYFHALASGYSANKSAEYIVKRERQSVAIEFVRVSTVNTTVAVISQLTGQPLAGAEVKVFDSSNVLIANGTTAAGGNLTFSLSAGSQYYSNVKKISFIRNVSEFFTPQNRIVVSLSPASNENSSVLLLSLLDEYNASLQGMASVYTLDGKVVDQSRSPNSMQTFEALQRGASFKVRASAMDRVAEKTVILSQAVNHETFVLDVRFAFLSLRAFDALTHVELSGVNVQIMRNGVQYANCTAPCNVTVKTRGGHVVNFSNSAYFDYVAPFGILPNQQVFEEGSTTQVNASMMSLSSVQDSQILLNGVYDLSTFQLVPVGGVIKQNRVYTASLSGYFANAQIASVFFTPANTAPSHISILNFTPFPGVVGSPDGEEVWSSASQDKADCGTSRTEGSFKRGLIHASLSPGTSLGQNYQFYFVAEPPYGAYGAYSNLSVTYKSLIQKSSGEYVRNPFDQNLGSSAIQTSGLNSECSSQAYSAVYNVESPNQAIGDLGSLTLSLFQNRSLATLVTSPAPDSCGTLVAGGSDVNAYANFDCNGFSVDSGVAKPLQVKVQLDLGHNVKGGIIHVSANPSQFSLANASFTVPSINTRFSTPSPVSPSPVFGLNLIPSIATANGYRSVSGEVNLSASGLSARTELVVEFSEVFENGSINPVPLRKTIWVTLNPIQIAASNSLLSSFKCGNQTHFIYDYDDGLLATGSGWSGCSEIPLVVDPIFPADAVPIYIENNSGSGNCVSVTGDALQYDVDVQSIVPQSALSGVDGCFELRKDTELPAGVSIPSISGYKGYLLRFNAAKCGLVVGNKVAAVNASFKLRCTGRAALGGLGNDDKIINITVVNATGRNLDVFKLKDTFDAKIYSTNAGAFYFYAPPVNAVQCPLGSFPVYVHSNSSTFDVASQRSFPEIFEIKNSSYNLNAPFVNNSCGYATRVVDDGNNRNHNEVARVNLSLWLTPYFQYNNVMQVNDSASLRVGHGRATTYGAEFISPLLNSTCPQSKEGFSPLLRQNVSNYVPDAYNITGRPDATNPSELLGYYCVVNTNSANIPPVPQIDRNNYVFAIVKKGRLTVPFDPVPWVVVDNLQLRSDKNNPRDIALSIGTPSATQPFTTFSITDQPAPAFAFAYSRQLYNYPVNLSENNVPYAQASKASDLAISRAYYVDYPSTKPLLEYVEDADAARKATAYRRTVGAVYYCLQGRSPSLNPDVCRATINDWVDTRESITFRTEACTICQTGANCDSTCNAGTHTKPNGTPCFNWCASPVCDAAGSQPMCDAATQTKQVPITGRSTQVWLNSTRLVQTRLVDASASLDEFGRDAPFKYFADQGLNSFNYTIVANLKDCVDDVGSISDFAAGRSFRPGCFVNAGSRNVLKGDKALDIDSMFAPPIAYGDAYGTFKISEQLGGCENSSVWERGYYRVTFSYSLNRTGGWSWQYYADPLEVSTDYVQNTNLRENPSACAVTNLGPSSDGTGSGGVRRSQLCYFTFSTSAIRTLEAPTSPGYCLRSLRDYIPEHPNVVSNGPLNYVASDPNLINIQNDKLPAEVRQTVPSDVMYLKNLDLEVIGLAKCPLNDDHSSTLRQITEPKFTCLHGNCGPLYLPPVSFNVSTFGVTYSGTVDWINKVNKDEQLDESLCSNWHGHDNDHSGSIHYAATTINGQFNPNGDQACFVACYISSCPYVYSFDGKNYNFEHEAFPQAGNLKEESYSYSLLKFAKGINGVVKIKSAEVKPEVSYTNNIQVFAVDVAKNVSVMPDTNGAFHTLGEKVTAAYAVDNVGQSVLTEVRSVDHIYWVPKAKPTEAAFLETEFAVPQDATGAKLIISLRKSNSLEREFGVLRGAIGDNFMQVVHSVIDAVPDFVYAAVYDNWVKRKMALGVQVWDEGSASWKEVESIRVAEDTERLVYLPVLPHYALSHGLKVRLTTTGDTFHIDEIYVDFSQDEPLTVSELKMTSAATQTGENMLDALQADDNLRYAQFIGDAVNIDFKDTPLKPGAYRRYVLGIKGYSIPFSGKNQTLEGFLSKGVPKIVKSIFDDGYRPSQG